MDIDVLYDVGGPAGGDATLGLFLPEGMYITPLPASLPLFATGIAGFGLLGWHGRRALRRS